MSHRQRFFVDLDPEDLQDERADRHHPEEGRGRSTILRADFGKPRADPPDPEAAAESDEGGDARADPGEPLDPGDGESPEA
jgi:hypothetical protein